LSLKLKQLFIKSNSIKHKQRKEVMDILTRLHNLPPSRFHYKLLVLVGIGWLFDAMDTGLVSFVLPALGKDWALAPAQLGWIVSIAFVDNAS